MNAARPEIADEAREIAATWCTRIAEGPLTVDERGAFQAWLDSDPEYPALFERTVAAWEALEDQAGEPELIIMRGAALDSVRRANRRRWTRSSAAWRPLAAIAACLLLFIAAGLWWQFSPTAYETGIGERRVVALEDGSSLSLDAATRVDVRYRSDRRELWLRRGRAKFSVARDPLRPFSVRAGDRMIVATGTQFSVEALPGQVRVVLYEGHVSVLDMAGPAPRPLVVDVGSNRVSAERALQPGRELVASTSAPVARLAQAGSAPSLAWEGGLLQFNDEPLGVAVERMNRYSAVKLRVGDPAASDTAISGQFVGGDVAAFVQGVTAIFPVRAAREGEGEIVLRARGPAGHENP